MAHISWLRLAHCLRGCAEPRRPDPSRAAAGRLILVVEDDPAIREVVQLLLQDEGFEVVVAADGVAALEQATLRRPALVVLDLSLPRLGGEAVAAALRARFADAVPIVVVSASLHAPEQAAGIGAAAFLRKPFDVDALLAAVQRGLGARRPDLDTPERATLPVPIGGLV